MDQLLLFGISMAVFLYSVILHEIAHGWVADKFGDDTARVSGRLSLNPLVHIDPMGSIILPVLLYLIPPHFAFGYAKPVPVNPARLQGGSKAYRLVALAGIITNLTIAIIAGMIIKYATQTAGLGQNNLGVQFFVAAFLLNTVLAVFNALPFPGFDGFNFLTTFRPIGNLIARTPLGNPYFMASYGMVTSFALLLLFWPFVGQVVGWGIEALSTLLGI